MALGSIPTAPLRLGRRLLDTKFAESLVSPNPIERYVDLIDPLWSRRDVRATVTSIEWQTSRSATITLKPNSNWKGFEAGQHIGVTVEIDGVLTTRFYSPACSAERNTDRIELTVTAHPHGKVSRHLVENARPGMVVGLSPAEGDFVLPTSQPEQILLISGGSGITPVMSMLRTLCERNYDRPVTFVHFARTLEDELYGIELKQIAREHPNVTIVHAFTREPEETRGAFVGHLTRKNLRAICSEFDRAEAFVCGPNALVDAAERIWDKDGIAGRLHTEQFVLPEPVVVADDATGMIVCTGSGAEIENDGRPLLTQAEDAGLTPRAGCRMGICHTCICHVEQGSVRNVRTGEVKTVSNEMVQICVNAPVGDVTINL
jgi:ferredoxin-NADP reductase